MPLDLDGAGALNTPVIELTQQRQVFRFRNVAERPVLSLNRGFSAPIHLTVNAPAEDELFLMGHDRDSFNRWEAGQARGRALILASLGQQAPAQDIARYAEALDRILKDETSDDAFKALMLGLPTEGDIAAAIGQNVDTDAIHAARDAVRSALGRHLAPSLAAIWARTAEKGPYRPDPASTARRSLRYAALQLIMMADPRTGIAAAMDDLARPHSMSAEIGALTALVQIESEARETALATFHSRHRQDHLLVDKWLMLHAQCAGAGAAGRVAALTEHEDFKWTTPNKVYALLSGFISGNPSGFNAADGSGYRLIADAIIRLNAVNPQVAARLATGFRSCKVLTADRKAAALGELERILAESNLSRDVFEIVSRIARG